MIKGPQKSVQKEGQRVRKGPETRQGCSLVWNNTQNRATVPPGIKVSIYRRYERNKLICYVKWPFWHQERHQERVIIVLIVSVRPDSFTHRWLFVSSSKKNSCRVSIHLCWSKTLKRPKNSTKGSKRVQK